MKIKILGKIDETPDYQDEFVVVGHAMFGDADSYENIVLGRYSNDKTGKRNLKEMVRLSVLMQNAYPQGMRGYDTYNHIPGYTELLGNIWPLEMFADGDASFQGYTVFYYDGLHEKYAVEVSGE